MPWSSKERANAGKWGSDGGLSYEGSERDKETEYNDNAVKEWCGRIVCILSIMYFNKTLIGQAGSIGGKTRQEVEVMQREQENSGKQRGSSATPVQTTEEAACNLPCWERYGAMC